MRSLFLIILAASSLQANPEWTRQLTSGKAGIHPPLESSKLEFSLSWKGIVEAGYLDIEIAPKEVRKNGQLVVRSSAHSQGLAKKLFPYTHSYWSEIHPSTFASRYFKSTETDSKEKIITTNRYSHSKTEVSEASTDLKTSKTHIQNTTFTQAGVRDLFSAILFVRSQKLDIGDTHNMVILPFKSPYLLKVKVESREKHAGMDAIRLSFAMQKIDITTRELIPYKKLKKPVTLWLSDDTDRIPLELRASVYIGDVRAVLSKHTRTP